MRKIIKHILAAGLYYSGFLYLYRLLINPGVHRGPTILMYHRVLKDAQVENKYVQDGLYISTDVFDRQLAYFKKSFTLLSLSQLVDLIEKQQPLPKKAAVITFDDGWRDNFIYAYPVLKKHNVPATIFLTTDYIDSDKPLWFMEAALLHRESRLTKENFTEIIEQALAKHEEPPGPGNRFNLSEIYEDSDLFLEFLKDLKPALLQDTLSGLKEQSDIDYEKVLPERSMLTWEEVKQMTDIIEFGSHGCSHHIMTNLTPEEIKRELTESRNKIEEHIGRPVAFLAYPNGDYNDTVIKSVAETGYRAAIATSRKKSADDPLGLYALRRVGVHEGMTVGIGGGFSRALFYLALSWRKNIL